MNKKIWFLIILNSVMVIFIIIYLLPPDFLKTSPNLSELEECKILKYNGDGNINILFFSSKEQAERYSDFFLTIDPFDTNNENFNFYYIDNYRPQCEIYQEKALLCYNKELTKKASSCPNDFIVVLEEKNSKIRSSAYMNVMSLNSKHSLTVLLHEFGHVFVNLAEEYVPAKLPRNAKNCVSDCVQFEVKDGCFLGCSREDYYRSIQNGIMRTLTSKIYGTFNTMLIINKIDDLIRKRKPSIIGQAIKEEADCAEQMYYLIHGKYQDGKIIIKDKRIVQGCAGGNIGSGELEYVVITETGLTSTDQFNPINIFTDAQEPEQEQITGEVFESDRDFFLKIPIPKKPKTLKIKKDERVLAEVDLKNIPTEVVNIPCRKI